MPLPPHLSPVSAPEISYKEGGRGRERERGKGGGNRKGVDEGWGKVVEGLAIIIKLRYMLSEHE